MTTQQGSMSEMVAQSRDVISNPSVATFERYEKHGNTGTAGVYVLVAAVIAGILTSLSVLVVGGNFFGTFVGGVVGALLNFVLFTGLVYYLGRTIAAGTGSWDEVAYTAALYIAPLAVISGALAFLVTLLGGIPVLGWLIGLAGGITAILVLLAQIYFGFLAVQSSMNIHDQGKALLVLVLAGIGTLVAQLALGAIGSILGGLIPIIILVALVAVVVSMIMRRGGLR